MVDRNWGTSNFRQRMLSAVQSLLDSATYGSEFPALIQFTHDLKLSMLEQWGDISEALVYPAFRT